VKWPRRRWTVAAAVAIPAGLLIGTIAIVAVATRSCWNPAGSRQGKVAAAFARALASEQYELAHRLLSRTLASQLDIATLRNEYESMIQYGRGPATDVRVMVALDYWPDKQRGDIGWAYASIAGEDFSEGVTVTVAEEGGNAVIRELEWGRP
jgi:hypothetical protein